MKILKNIVEIKFEKEKFTGLSITTDHPWRNRKEMNAYYDKLMGDKSIQSRIEYKKVVKDTIIRTIHTYISWSFILKYLPIVIISIGFILALLHFHLLSGILLIISPIPFLIRKYVINQCSKFYFSIDFTLSVVDMLFEMELDKDKSK